MMICIEPENIINELTVSMNESGDFLLTGTNKCIEEESISDILEAANYEIVLALINFHSNLLWLHAGCVRPADDHDAILLPGVSGSGKSTLSAGLMAHGWVFLSDDTIPVELPSKKIYPFLRTPAVRYHSGREVPHGNLSHLDKFDINLCEKSTSQDAAFIKAIIFPKYCYDTETSLIPFSPSLAVSDLLKNCLNFTHHQQEAIHFLCDLVRNLPIFRLSFSDCNLAVEQVLQLYSKHYRF